MVGKLADAGEAAAAAEYVPREGGLAEEEKERFEAGVCAVTHRESNCTIPYAYVIALNLVPNRSLSGSLARLVVTR